MDATAQPGATGQGSGTVELAHFWGEGDGAAMLEAVLTEFGNQYPNITIDDRSYDNHGLAIKSRILQDNPPSVFVEWPDQNLVPYQEAGALRDVTELWEDNDWERAFVDGAAERSRVDGKYVGVPVDIHRMNNLFYHVDLVEELGIDPGRISDPRELMEVLEQCERDGLIGMEQPMKNPQVVLQLWSTMLIGQFGAPEYMDITSGSPGSYKTEIRETLELVDRCWEVTSDDAMFNDMVDANNRFMDRQSVFYNQGDWMAGEYAEAEDFEYGRDWGRVNFPGTDGVYMLGTDLIASASNSDFTPETRTFMEFMGSKPALEVLNRVKGSIPPRNDISLDDYPVFLQEQYQEFKQARYFPAGHALEVTPDVFINARSAISDFIATRDVDAATEALVDVYRGEY
jgi:glucose/mannose transport system substrate-binding protein